MTTSIIPEQAAFLQDFCRLIQYAVSTGFVVTAGELLRPIEMQKIYVETGRSKTMNSLHIRKLAGDLNFFKPDAEGKLVYVCSVEELKELGKFWEELSPKNRWGGNFNSFKDAPHFERRT